MILHFWDCLNEFSLQREYVLLVFIKGKNTSQLTEVLLLDGEEQIMVMLSYPTNKCIPNANFVEICNTIILLFLSTYFESYQLMLIGYNYYLYCHKKIISHGECVLCVIIMYYTIWVLYNIVCNCKLNTIYYWIMNRSVVSSHCGSLY